MGDRSLSAVLGFLTISALVGGGRAVLAPSTAFAEAFLRGRVLDESGEPVAGARVTLRAKDASDAPSGAPLGVVTGADGAFVLPAAEGDLIVRSFGFREWTAPVGARNGERALEVRLIQAVYSIAGLEVTALRRPARDGEHTTPVSRITGEALWGQRASLPTVADRLRTSPEVTLAGRDEYNAAPAVRGLARFRTVLLFDGARIHSDREIGPSAGFVDPAMLGRVEVVRGPGSVLYGSDAIGGVVALYSFAAEVPDRRSWLETGWSSANRGFRSSSGGTLKAGDARLSFALARAEAGDYVLPGSSFPWSGGTRRAENSGFTRSAAHARLSVGRMEYGAFYSLGSDIGRPAREAERFTVDRDEHVLHSVLWRSGGSESGGLSRAGPGGPASGGSAPAVEARAYVHPNRWRASVDEPREDGGVRHQERNYRSLDWGALVTAAPRRGALSWLFGLQADARSDVSIVRALEDRDASGTVTGARRDPWVAGASAGHAGALAHLAVAAPRARFQAGARLDRAWRHGTSRDAGRFVPSGQLGFASDGSGIAVWSANVATAFREPTVTELFFEGGRPAGYIEGNPDLKPERSYHLDLGARWNVGGAAVSLSTFGILLRDFITLATRATGAADTLRFANASRARLYGVSLEGRARSVWRGITGRVAIDAIRGEDGDGVPLPDLNGPRALIEAVGSRGRTTTHLTWRGVLPHRRPGAGEISIPGYGVLDAGTTVQMRVVRLGLTLQNVLDQEIYERGEPGAYPAPARSLLVSVRFTP